MYIDRGHEEIALTVHPRPASSKRLKECAGTFYARPGRMMPEKNRRVSEG